MAVPHGWWRLIGWIVALTTLAFAFGQVEDVFQDLYRLDGCGEAGPPQTCAVHRLLWGAAEVLVVVTVVPAIGLGLIAAGLWFGPARKEGAGSREAEAGGTTDGEADGAETKGRDADGGPDGPAPAGRRRKRHAAQEPTAA